ncbi:myb family transcription factor PHL5-like isoform X2 [Lotus japonicus]|uniref:myb family transcription factor PHL5-like isoform X2 n=1 Tax=Lotus japonicus TaxID=34305 RepID=UPI00258D6CDA|nr:myb family transcription factor PHL5-like isoform X2 [Lotus japonicus]
MMNGTPCWEVVGSELLSFEPIKSPYNFVTTTASPVFGASAKSLVSFQAQEHDHGQNQNIDVPGWCYEFPSTPMMIFQGSEDNFTNVTSTVQDRPSSQFTSSLHSVAESFISSSEDSHSCSENYGKIEPGMPLYDHLLQEQLRNNAATDKSPLEISFQRNQLGSCTKQEKQAPGLSRRSPTSKRRIRWSKDLHEPFMMIVNSLGGPEKAKPKAILEMMKSDLLSISHIKSHLQKCRSTTYMHKALQERSEGRHRTDGVTELQVQIHMQIEESRKLQLEVRRSICLQLEMQQNLKMLIEGQRKELKVMLDRQKERT